MGENATEIFKMF